MNIDVSSVVNEISADLLAKLESVGEKPNKTTLDFIVKKVVREVMQIREYPETYSEDEVLTDLNRYYGVIFGVSEYDYNLIGAEGEESHSENGVSRHYVARDKFFNGVYKFVKFF